MMSRIVMYWAYEQVCDYYSKHDIEITLAFAHETIKRLALNVWDEFYGHGEVNNDEQDY